MTSWDIKVNIWWKKPSTQRLIILVQDSSMVTTAVKALEDTGEDVLANLVSYSLTIHLIQQYLLFLRCCNDYCVIIY